MFVSDQLTLIVKKLSIPAPRNSCGSAGVKPKQSGSQQTSWRAPKRALEVALPVEQLPHERLAGGHVEVGLDPHAADRLPLARRRALLHPREQLRVVLLHEGVELRGRVVERQLRVAVHQPERGVEGALGLAPRLLHRPQPCEVDVRVAGERERAVRRVAALQRAQLGLERDRRPRGRPGGCPRRAPADGRRARRAAPRSAASRASPSCAPGSRPWRSASTRRASARSAQPISGSTTSWAPSARPASSTRRSWRSRRSSAGSTQTMRASASAGVAVGDAERQARDGGRLQRELALAQREAAVLGVEPERLLAAAGVAHAHQALAAEVEVQASVVERPPIRHGGAGVRQGDDVLEPRPGLAEADRLAVEASSRRGRRSRARARSRARRAAPRAASRRCAGVSAVGCIALRSRPARRRRARPAQGGSRRAPGDGRRPAPAPRRASTARAAGGCPTAGGPCPRCESHTSGGWPSRRAAAWRSRSAGAAPGVQLEVEDVLALVGEHVAPAVDGGLAAAPRHLRAAQQRPLPAPAVERDRVGVVGQPARAPPARTRRATSPARATRPAPGSAPRGRRPARPSSARGRPEASAAAAAACSAPPTAPRRAPRGARRRGAGSASSARARCRACPRAARARAAAPTPPPPSRRARAAPPRRARRSGRCGRSRCRCCRGAGAGPRGPPSRA